MKKLRKFASRSYLERWSRLTALVSKLQQQKLEEICRFWGGKPGTLATELTRIAATVKPEEYADFMRSVKAAAKRHARADNQTALKGDGLATS